MKRETEAKNDTARKRKSAITVNFKFYTEKPHKQHYAHTHTHTKGVSEMFTFFTFRANCTIHS